MSCFFFSPPEILLWPAAKEDGWDGHAPSGGIAELQASVERRFPGQHKGRGLHLGWGVRHRTRKAGNYNALSNH